MAVRQERLSNLIMSDRLSAATTNLAYRKHFESLWIYLKGVNSLSDQQQHLISPIFFCTLFLLCTVLSIAICIAIFRSPFRTPGLLPIVKSTALASALFFTWQAVSIRSYLWKAKDNFWPIVTSLTVLFLPCAAPSSTLVSWALTSAFAVITVCGIFEAITGLKREPGVHLIALLAAPILGVALFLYANTLWYSTVFTPEFSLIGLQHRDTLFHAAIASMISQQGVVSTGLDGLVAVKYHFLSHLWIGLGAKWLEVPTIHAYYLLTQIVALPLVLFWLTTASYDLMRRRDIAVDAASVVLLPVTLLLIVGISESEIRFIISESYQFGLALFLLGLPALTQLATGRGSGSTILVAVILGLLLVLCKSSIGTIWFCGLVYITMRVNNFSLPSIGLSAIILTVCLLALNFFVASVTSAGGYLELFTYVRDYPLWAYVAIGVMVFFALVGSLIYKRSAPSERTAIELFFALALASFVPAMIIHAPGGSAGYFLDVIIWVAIVFIAYNLESFWWAPRLISPGLLIAIILGSWAVAPGKLRAWENFEMRVASLAGAETQQIERSGGSLFLAWATLRAAAERIPETYGAQAARLLKERVGYGTRTLVFIPPSNEAFWHLSSDCVAQSFFVPALVALPMIKGLPPHCPSTVRANYGYEYYQNQDAVSTEVTDKELCERALGRGFANVFVFLSIDQNRTLDCISTQRSD